MYTQVCRQVCRHLYRQVIGACVGMRIHMCIDICVDMHTHSPHLHTACAHTHNPHPHGLLPYTQPMRIHTARAHTHSLCAYTQPVYTHGPRIHTAQTHDSIMHMCVCARLDTPVRANTCVHTCDDRISESFFGREVPRSRRLSARVHVRCPQMCTSICHHGLPLVVCFPASWG